MSSLIFVRHGQASLHGEDYDVLSDLGAEQSRHLGRFWAERSARIDTLYAGPQKRHLESAAALREGAAAAGLALPETTTLEGLAEMDATVLFAQAMERVLPSLPDLRERMARGEIDDEVRKALHHVAGIVGNLVERWADGEEVGEGMEPFAAFERRVVDAVQTIMKTEQRGKRVAIVTSGGPVCVALRLALGTSAPQAIRLMTVLGNASLSEIFYTENRLTLARFNSVDHLPLALQTRV